MAALEDVLGLYDQSNFDIGSTAALIRQLGQQAGLSEEELAAAVPVFGDYHRSVYNSGYTEGSNYSAIAQRAVSDALAARGTDPSRFNQATQGFVDQGAQQAQQRWQETQKDTSFGSTGLGKLASTAGQALASYFGGPIGAAASSYALSGGDVGKAALSAGMTYAGGQLSGTGSGAPGGSWYSPSGDISSVANKLTSAFGSTSPSLDISGGLDAPGIATSYPGSIPTTLQGLNATDITNPSALTAAQQDALSKVTIDGDPASNVYKNLPNQVNNLGANTGGNMAGEFDLGDYQSFPTNSPNYTDLGEYQSFPAPSPSGGYAPGAGGEGTLSADEFAANAGVGAPGATASGLGMLQKLMAATGLSEKQLMGLGAAGISSLTSLYGASQIGKAATNAANIGQGAADRATALQTQMYQDQLSRSQPFYQTSVNALGPYTKGIMGSSEDQAAGRPGSLVRPFDVNRDYIQSPYYQFSLDKKLKDYTNKLAAMGRVDSGPMRRGVLDIASAAGQEDITNAYNRYNQDLNTRRTALGNLAGYGPPAAAVQNAASSNYATNVGNLGMGAASNRIDAGLAAERANQSAYTTIGNAFSNYLAPNPMNTFFQNQLNKNLGA